MSWASKQSERLLVVGGARVWTCAIADRRPVADSVLTADVEGDLLANAIRAMLSGIAEASSVRMVISDHWLAAAEIPWTPTLLNEAQAHTYICGQMELLGLRPEDLRVAVDDAPFGQPRVAVAMSVALLESSKQAARERGSTLASIRPLSAVVHEQVRSQIAAHNYALAVLEPGAVSILVIRDRRIQQIATHRVTGDAGRELERHWRRMQLRDPELATFSLYAADFNDAPVLASSSGGLKLLQPVATQTQTTVPTLLTMSARAASNAALAWRAEARKPQRWQVAAAVVSAAMLLGATGMAVRGHQQILDSEARLQALNEPVQTKPKRALTRAEEEQLKRLQQQLAIFDVPLDDLLLAVRPPKEIDAALLGFDMTMSRTGSNDSSIRVSGEARSSEAMTHYVSHLARTPPFTGAHLARHEAVDSPQGVYRFVIEASWSP